MVTAFLLSERVFCKQRLPVLPIGTVHDKHFLAIFGFRGFFVCVLDWKSNSVICRSGEGRVGILFYLF